MPGAGATRNRLDRDEIDAQPGSMPRRRGREGGQGAADAADVPSVDALERVTGTGRSATSHFDRDENVGRIDRDEVDFSAAG